MRTLCSAKPFLMANSRILLTLYTLEACHARFQASAYTSLVPFYFLIPLLPSTYILLLLAIPQNGLRCVKHCFFFSRRGVRAAIRTNEAC
ncbi:hypothetical protein ACJBU6_06448 [Exserohilum turcicum]